MAASKSNTVRLTLDPKNLPPLSAEQKARLAALDALPDEQIDTSDAPFLPDAAWVRAIDVSGGKQQRGRAD